VQDFIKLIFNKKLMEESVVKIGYDVKKLPLGDLSKETVLKGYQILRSIENVLAGTSKESLEDLSSDFYTNIPHNFGMKKMINFLIDTNDKVKEKLDLIQNLVDIQVACDIAKEPAKKTNLGDLAVNPIDINYEQLKCSMTTLKESEGDFKVIQKFV
jgi:poly [ADP-ribose] polymerase